MNVPKDSLSLFSLWLIILGIRWNKYQLKRANLGSKKEPSNIFYGHRKIANENGHILRLSFLDAFNFRVISHLLFKETVANSQWIEIILKKNL